MDRFQRFQTGSRTGRPACGSSGSTPIGVGTGTGTGKTAVSDPIGSRTANGALDVHDLGSSPPLAPRLLNLHQGAAYLSLSYWSLRAYVLSGLVPVVELPPLRPRDGERARTTLRRVLVDREDLDALIEARKRGSARDIQSRAPQNEPVNTGRNRATVPTLCPDRTVS